MIWLKKFADPVFQRYYDDRNKGGNMSSLNDPRVLFAAERTLLAWNRTSLALIAFGFVIERAGLFLQAMAPEKATGPSHDLTFWLGQAFIILGAMAALYASRQFLVVLKTLQPAEFPDGYKARWGLAINILVALLGLALAVVLHL